MRRAITKIVRREFETKSNQITTSPVLVESFIGASQVLDLQMVIPRGTGESDRVGNRIKPIKYTVKMWMECFNQSAGTSPTYFDIYIFKYKSNSGSIAPGSAEMNRFLNADNSAQQYLGLITDGLRAINDDLFTLVAKRRVLLFNPFNSTNHLAATSSLQPSRTFHFDVTKHVKKTWMYDDGTNLPTNDNLWMAVGSTQSDGTTLIGTTGRYQCICECKYKDA